ncbi:MAG TPA: TauD/TfdA family dioxygenase, partial [Acidimicrobiales bacterium]
MTATEPTVALDIRKLAGALGAEVRGIDLATPLTDEQFDAIRAALLEHLVLFFPDQRLTPEQHRDFASRWGEMEIHPYLDKVDGYPEVVVLRGAIADVWHTDVTFSERPPVMSILHMVSAPPFGGDTMWSNQYAAYEALSPALRELLDGLTAIHTARTYGKPEHCAEHPAVRVHPETGRRCLYVNGQFTERFPQLSRDESDMLLRFLVEFMAQPRFTVRRAWQTGTVAMWDNRCTQHMVVNDIDANTERVINRVTILGDKPAGDEPRWPHWQPSGRISAAEARNIIG